MAELGRDVNSTKRLMWLQRLSYAIKYFLRTCRPQETFEELNVTIEYTTHDMEFGPHLNQDRQDPQSLEMEPKGELSGWK